MEPDLLSEDYVSYVGPEDSKPEFIPLPKIQDQSIEERPYEKAKKYGITSLTDSQLLAIILRSGLPGKPITRICRDIMEECMGKFRKLGSMSPEALLNHDGIGEVKVLQIRAVMEIVKRYNSETIDRTQLINSSLSAAKLMMPLIGSEPVEHIYAIYLSQSLRLLQLGHISSGVINSTVFDVKPILRKALLVNSTGIMLCHNHPSGQMRPSIQDDKITRDLKEACKLFNIRLLDHIIVGGGSNDNPDYYSYADNGRI